jgi:hypothetical protein
MEISFFFMRENYTRKWKLTVLTKTTTTVVGGGPVTAKLERRSCGGKFVGFMEGKRVCIF